MQILFFWGVGGGGVGGKWGRDYKNDSYLEHVF